MIKSLTFLKEQRRRHQNMADSMKVVYFDDELDEAIEELENAKNTLCNDCIYYLSDNGNFPLEPCTDCSRFYADKFVRK